MAGIRLTLRTVFTLLGFGLCQTGSAQSGKSRGFGGRAPDGYLPTGVSEAFEVFFAAMLACVLEFVETYLLAL